MRLWEAVDARHSTTVHLSDRQSDDSAVVARLHTHDERMGDAVTVCLSLGDVRLLAAVLVMIRDREDQRGE